jgi:hypothetical protein
MNSGSHGLPMKHDWTAVFFEQVSFETMPNW